MKKNLKVSLLTIASLLSVGTAASLLSYNTVKDAAVAKAEEALNEVAINADVMKKNDAVTVNAVNAPANRYAINIFLKTDGLCDAPVSQIENNPSELTRVSAPYDETMTANDLYARARALNIFQGFIEIDGVPMNKRYSGSETGFWDTGVGRCYLGKTSANQFQLHIDVMAPLGSGYHQIVLKKGAQIPTFAYFTNKDTSMYTKNTVLTLPETYIWQVNGSNNLSSTYIGHTPGEKVLKDRVGFGPKGVNAIYSNTTANRSAFYFDVISNYSVYNTNGYKSGIDGNNLHFDYHDASATDTREFGGMHLLHFWDHVLIDDQPAYANWTDARVQHSYGGLLGFGRMGIDLTFRSVASCTEKDTFTLTFLKGMEIPTPAAYTSNTETPYLLTDASYKFTFKATGNAAAGGAKSFDVTKCEVIDDSAWNAASEDTEVLGLIMTQHSSTATRLAFKLSNYDYGYENENTLKDVIKNVNDENNAPTLINRLEANYYDNILFNGVSCSSYVSNAKTVLGYKGVGFIANFPIGTPVDEITIKAGTRFPAQSYAMPNPSTPGNIGDTPKFYKTTSDVTLKYDAAQKRWIRTDVVKEVTPTRMKFAANSTNSMQFCVHLDGADYSSAGRRTVNAAMRKTDNMWTGITFDGTPLVDKTWEGTSGTYDRSSRSTVTGDFHQFQMVGDYTNPGIKEVFIPKGTYFYSSAMLDQGAGAKEIYKTAADVTFYNFKNATTYGTAAEYAEYEAGLFLDSVVCDNGVTAPSTTEWNNFATRFATLPEAVKTLFTEATANEAGTNVQKVAARYDYIVAKYGETSYANFMTRSVSSAPAIKPNTFNTTNVTAIVAVTAVLSLTAVAGLAISKKKKEN